MWCLNAAPVGRCPRGTGGRPADSGRADPRTPCTPKGASWLLSVTGVSAQGTVSLIGGMTGDVGTLLFVIFLYI